MKKSPNLDLSLPTYTDNADVVDLSENFEKIDMGVAVLKAATPAMIEETAAAVRKGGLAQFTYGELTNLKITHRALEQFTHGPLPD
jgi:hypothetical protein